MSSVPTTYFYKELLSNKAYLPNGKTPNWEPVGEDCGVLATNDANLIFHLSNLAQRHVGGVVKIDEAQYSEAKKNSSAHVSPRPLERETIGSPNPAPSLTSLAPTPAAAPVAVEAAVKPSDPVAPVKVRTGRAKPVAPSI